MTDLQLFALFVLPAVIAILAAVATLLYEKFNP